MIRVFEPGDAPAVARLFLKVFRREKQPEPRQALIACLCETFLHAPDADPDIRSRVFVGHDGQVKGFVGVMPARFQCNGREVRAAYAGTLMVDDPQRDPLAGARLLRAASQCGQDITLSETSNPISQRMWEKTGGRTVPGYSLDYIKVLRPAGLGVALAAQRARLMGCLAAPARLADLLAAKPFRDRTAPDAQCGESDLDSEGVAAIFEELAATHAFRPAFTPEALRWRIERARVKDGYGLPLRRAVTGRNGEAVGFYLYHLRPGGIAHVLHLDARPSHMEETARRLILDARARGAVAVKGRADPRGTAALGRLGAMFVHRSAVTVHTRDASLLAPVMAGDARVTGLAGEIWTGLIGGTFQ